MATTQQMRERIEAFARELAEEFGEMDTTDALSWLDAVETQSAEIGDAVATELIKNKAAKHEQDSDEGVCPQCGKLGRYRGRRERSLLTRRGKTTIQEPEYYCPCCRKAFFPDDPSNRR